MFRVMYALFLTLVLSWAKLGATQEIVGVEPRLVQDFNSCQEALSPGFHIRVGDRFFFTGRLSDRNALFGVLGPTGVTNVRLSGVSSADAGLWFLGAVDGVVYFTFTWDRTSLGLVGQLWRSDGTEGGTRLVKTVSPGAKTPSVFQIYPFGKGTFIFRANSAEFGSELWVSDGTAEGTRVLDTIRPGPASSDPQILTQSGLILAQGGEGRGTELYQLTPQFTLDRIDRIFPRMAAGATSVITPIGSELVFFSITTTENGSELWVTDGTAGGTRFLKDFVPGSASPKSVAGSTVRGRKVYFVVEETGGFQALWESNGTSEGTRLIYPFNPDWEFKNVTFLTPTGKGVVFQADTKPFGRELWFSDGTIENTGPITDRPLFYKGANITGVVALPHSPGLTVVGLESPLTGTEVFVTDGTRAGTTLLRDHIPGPDSGSPQFYEDTVKGKVLYLAYTRAGQTLFETNGTVDGTRPMQRTGTGVTGDSNVAQVIPLDTSRVVFAAKTGCDGTTQLFSLHTGTLEAQPIRSAFPQGERSIGMSLQGKNSRGVFFANITVAYGSELWFSDGTSAGTQMAADINPNSASSNPAGSPSFAMLGERLFFFADDGVHGREPYISDGTRNGTLRLADLYPGPESSDGRGQAVSTGKRIVFIANSRSGVLQIWSTDGTPDKLVLLHERPAAEASGFSLIKFGDRAAFTRKSGSGTPEVWTTDGTQEGTFLFLDLKPYVLDSWNALQSVGEKMLITVKNASSYERILSDGSASGTVLLSVPPQFGALATSAFSVLSVNGNTALLAASTQAVGQELWSLDTVTGALTLVRDISPGSPGSSPSNALAAGPRTFFTATTPSIGQEVWVTTGVGSDTREIFDFSAGPINSGGRALYANEDLLLANYYSPVTGYELYYVSRTDRCLSDPNKNAPGACGCGVADRDVDGDGILDCRDGCPLDPMKDTPGLCGCGVSDEPSPGSSAPSCGVADLCPDDPLKTGPGICGCGIVDADVDRDGVIDCLTQDLCPSDPLKDLPGVCGCGVKDGDTDGDRLPDCIADKALRFNIQEAIARVQALRLKKTTNLSQAALRKLRKEVREASIFVQSVLAQVRSASRTFPSLGTKRGRKALQEAQQHVRNLRKNMARDAQAKLLRSLRTLRNILP